LQASGSNCVFLTHEWMSSWWKHLAEGRRLAILTARDGRELVGILPVAERAAQYSRMMPRTLEFLGSGVIGSDYLDVIAVAGREREVIAAFSRHIDDRGLMLQLSQLRRGSCLAALLAEQLREQAWTAEETTLNVCPYIDLRGHTWASYLATVGPNLRKNVNRYLRNLPNTFDMRVDCARAPAEAQRALDAAIALHRKRWGAAPGMSEAFHSEAIIAFHRDFVTLAAEQGWLRLLVLHLNGTPVAALYGLLYGSVFYFYQSGFDPEYGKHSVGVATMAIAIKTAIEEGAVEYDFLHGAEEYKFHWTEKTRDLGRIELFPSHARALIYRRAMDLNRAARRMARRVLKATA